MTHYHYMNTPSTAAAARTPPTLALALALATHKDVSDLLILLRQLVRIEPVSEILLFQCLAVVQLAFARHTLRSCDVEDRLDEVS